MRLWMPGSLRTTSWRRLCTMILRAPLARSIWGGARCRSPAGRLARGTSTTTLSTTFRSRGTSTRCTPSAISRTGSSRRAAASMRSSRLAPSLGRTLWIIHACSRDPRSSSTTGPTTGCGTLWARRTTTRAWSCRSASSATASTRRRASAARCRRCRRPTRTAASSPSLISTTCSPSSCTRPSRRLGRLRTPRGVCAPTRTPSCTGSTRRRTSPRTLSSSSARARTLRTSCACSEGTSTSRTITSASSW
mmetsp:Transcript_50034/g.122144  ORF Transcript_50034/g.122144 Transcript_50034/m.122144 type:complete len:249 (-) Transcript_50034:193-939(-)